MADQGNTLEEFLRKLADLQKAARQTPGAGPVVDLLNLAGLGGQAMMGQPGPLRGAFDPRVPALTRLGRIAPSTNQLANVLALSQMQRRDIMGIPPLIRALGRTAGLGGPFAIESPFEAGGRTGFNIPAQTQEEIRTGQGPSGAVPRRR